MKKPKEHNRGRYRYVPVGDGVYEVYAIGRRLGFARKDGGKYEYFGDEESAKVPQEAPAEE